MNSNDDFLLSINARYNRIIRYNRLFVILIISLLTIIFFPFNNSHATLVDKVLRVGGIVVTDENGIDRVWIGAPVRQLKHCQGISQFLHCSVGYFCRSRKPSH
jgi:hypothetical protein